MGIVLCDCNLTGLIVLFKQVGQDHATFWSEIETFIFYILHNTILLLNKESKSKLEEHKLRENNKPVDNAPVSNFPAAVLEVNALPVYNSPPAN